MTDSIYILSTKSNSYIGHYSGNVTSLLKYEWEGMDVEVELYYKHSKAKELVGILRKYFKVIDSKEKDAYGFWVKKLTREELDSILITLDHKEQKPKLRILGPYYIPYLE